MITFGQIKKWCIHRKYYVAQIDADLVNELKMLVPINFKNTVSEISIAHGLIIPMHGRSKLHIFMFDEAVAVCSEPEPLTSLNDLSFLLNTMPGKLN